MTNPNTSGPEWLDHARSYIGLREIKGRRHNATILRWLKDLRFGFSDDETPWCGTFVAAVLHESGKPFLRNGASARAWLNYGVKIDRPAVGAIVVFERGNNGWSGHVGFVVGVDRRGDLMVLGGNQDDMVRISPFDTDRVLGYRWAGTAPLAHRYDLPVLDSDGRLSMNEA